MRRILDGEQGESEDWGWLGFAVIAAIIAVIAVVNHASSQGVPTPDYPSGTARDLDCGDFSYHEDAQRFYDASPADPHGLDGDDDGIACELLPRRARYDSYPERDYQYDDHYREDYPDPDYRRDYGDGYY